MSQDLYAAMGRAALAAAVAHPGAVPRRVAAGLGLAAAYGAPETFEESTARVLAQAVARPTRPKEVWLTKGVVCPSTAGTEDGWPNAKPGEVEWQFNDSWPNPGGSADYLSLEEGLRAHSGCVVHWVDLEGGQ